MDLIKNIENQIVEIKNYGYSTFLDLIYSHLERAKLYFKNGKDDEHFFNDVIYRTNQAFEGALKEAYKVLVNKTDEEVSRKTPNEIEKYLKENTVFKEKVLKQFEIYRQEWRNKSTHDFKFVSDENEALLALINVSSFVYLLFKQILEKLAYNKELKKELNQNIIEKTNEILTTKKSFVDTLIELLALYTKEKKTDEQQKEVEIIGEINAFLERANKDFQIYREPNYSIGNIHIRPDFVIEYENEKIVIEVKKKAIKGRLKVDIDQITSYLSVTGIKNGILYFADSKIKDNQLLIDVNDVYVNENVYKVYTII